MSYKYWSNFKRYRFIIIRFLKEKDKINFKLTFQNDHPQSLYTSWRTPIIATLVEP
jgi:hypothetical protein